MSTDDIPAPWWKTAVAYQIYPRSFCDTDGDGVGDLEGIRRHLDHLVWLGVDAIWLSPFYRSPMDDYGYDVADYCDVDPLYGDLAAFDALVADAHGRGLRVVVDWVPNHTSVEHPWFVESRSSRDSAKRDWYLWRDPPEDGSLPNNWVEALTFGPAWTLDQGTGQYYLHNFFASQPDLNWGNREVVEAMFDTLRFWLDRGVDGFRMDVVNLIGKDPALPDDPDELAGLPHLVVNDRPETHALLREIRTLIDGYPNDRMAIGEVILLSIEGILGHLGHPSEPGRAELHLAFNFPPMHAAWTAGNWRKAIDSTERHYSQVGGWPTWVLSNHDVVRHRTRYGSESRARAAAVLLLTLRGTVFLYAGEELGLEDAVVPPDRVRDPGGRDGCRAPVPWDGSPSHGWAPSGDGVAEPWLPWPPDAGTRNVATLAEDEESTLWLYRTLLSLRRATPVLQVGDLELLDTPDGVVGYRRGKLVTVLVNFTGESIDVLPGEPWDLLVSSSGSTTFAGRLGPDEAVVIRHP